MGLLKTVGIEWFKKLAKEVKPALYTRTVQGRDWVISGEFPVTLMSYAKGAEEVRKTGVSVKLVYLKEGGVMTPFPPIILADAPHSNTAKLFIDYVRSVRGANVIADSGAHLYFGRPGIKNRVPDLMPAIEDIRIIPMDWDVDCTDKAFRDIQKMCIDVGLC